MAEISRPGTKVLYRGEPGEKIKLLPDGRAIVAGGDNTPRILHSVGKIEPLTPETDPELWAVFESTIKQLLTPN